jgi:hypothetical protein
VYHTGKNETRLVVSATFPLEFWPLRFLCEFSTTSAESSLAFERVPHPVVWVDSFIFHTERTNRNNSTSLVLESNKKEIVLVMDPQTPHPSATSSPLFSATINMTTSNGLATRHMNPTEPMASQPPPPPHPVSLQHLLFLDNNADCSTLQQPPPQLQLQLHQLQTSKRLQIQTLAKQIRDRRIELKQKLAPSLARPREERSNHDQFLVSQFTDWNRHTRHMFLQHLQSIPESQLSPAQARMLRRFQNAKKSNSSVSRSSRSNKKGNGNNTHHHHRHFFLDSGAEISWRRISSSASGNSNSNSGGPPPTSSSLASLYQSMERLGIANPSGATLAPIPGLEPTVVAAGPPVTRTYHSSTNTILHHDNNDNSMVPAATVTTTVMIQDGHNDIDRMM